MELAQTVLAVVKDGKPIRFDATRIRFSAHQCFAFDDGHFDLACLRQLANHLVSVPNLAAAIDGDATFLHYLLRHEPRLREHFRGVIVESIPADGSTELAGLPVILREEMPGDIQAVFLAETRTYPRMRMRRWLDLQNLGSSAGTRPLTPVPSPPEYRGRGASQDTSSIIDLDVLPTLGLDALPARAWAPWARDTIYPIDLPEIAFEKDLDALIIDLPARNLGLMPNGLGYVHNALKQVDVRYQTCDIDILMYHRFHIRRLFDEGGIVRLPSGRELPTDPWQAEHYDLWLDPEVIAYFEPEIQEIVAKLTAANPKVLGLSIHSCNEKFSATVVERVKANLPDLLILVGGFSCYSPDIGLRAFPLADYMCVGESDLVVGPLVERLAQGERPTNTPGVLCRFDPPGTPFLPAPMVHDLDLLEHPRYEWYDLDLYRNYNGYQLTPVIASRGCRWSRCTFCAERFYWRIRSPQSFVDELEWLISKGCRLFMFNESDLNGKPEIVLQICDEILRRGLKVKLTGQLRIHRKCDRAFFDKLHQAGFVALRFGVDAFSENALKLQKKGYTTADISQNLKDCWEAGIYTEVNWVIGVPGETDQDVEEGIALILQNQPFIGRLANINPLILSTGSVYWIEPEKHHIHFRAPREQLYHDHPRAIPACMWYSTEPMIDEKVRKDRFERIVLALHHGGFPVGAWAHRIIEDVKLNRDKVRSGSVESEPEQRSLSAGVGSMEPAEAPEAGQLEFNADARSSSYVYRAGSALPEDKTYSFRNDLAIVAKKGEFFGVEPTALAPVIDLGAGNEGRTFDCRGRADVIFVKTKLAVPELIQSIAGYNIVQYDGLYYGLPQNPDPVWHRLTQEQMLANGFIVPPTPPVLTLRQRMRGWPWATWKMGRFVAKHILIALGLKKPYVAPPLPPCQVHWGEVDVASLPGVVTGNTFEQVSAQIGFLRTADPAFLEPRASPSSRSLPMVEALQESSAPKLVGSLEGYNLVEFDGWFYGLPQSLGPLDLRKVDVIENPGVIRDLSREVVEGEIRELVSMASRG